MATAILAVAATAAGGLASGLVGGGVIGAVVGAAVTVGVSYLGSALIGTPDPPAAQSGENEQAVRSKLNSAYGGNRTGRTAA